MRSSAPLPIRMIILTEKIRLYSRIQCPLCEKAKLILEEVQKESGIQFEEIDIYKNEELTELYGLMIPVIEWKGEIIQYGQVNKHILYHCIKK